MLAGGVVPSTPTRRRVLAALSLSALGLAGCSDDPTSPETEDGGPGQAGGTPSPDRRTTGVGSETETATRAPAESEAPAESANGTASGATETPGTATRETELDLREANVVDAAVEESDGAYRFDVTLLHDVHESLALVS